MSNARFSLKAALVGTVLSACLAAAPAMADYNESIHTASTQGRSTDAGPYSDWAKVLRVEPLHRTVQVSTPRQECWEEPVKRYRTHGYGHHKRSYTPVIIGGILGGVIGNQFGRGSGNVLTTAAGAILGGSVARDAQAHHHDHHHAARESYTTYERRCETTHVYHD